MDPLDLDLTRGHPGAVRLGTARIAAMDPEEDGAVALLLESSTCVALGRAARSVVEGLAEGDCVTACGVLIREQGDDLLQVEALWPQPPTRGGSAVPLLEEGEGVLVDLPYGVAAYVLWLMAADLARWGDNRKTRLTRDEARGLAAYLHDCLPPAYRTPLPPLPAERAA